MRDGMVIEYTIAQRIVNLVEDIAHSSSAHYPALPKFEIALRSYGRADSMAAGIQRLLDNGEHLPPELLEAYNELQNQFDAAKAADKEFQKRGR